jgi:hypothetical protein
MYSSHDRVPDIPFFACPQTWFLVSNDIFISEKTGKILN